MLSYKYLFNGDVFDRATTPAVPYGVVLEGGQLLLGPTPFMPNGSMNPAWPGTPQTIDIPSFYSFGTAGAPTSGSVIAEVSTHPAVTISDIHMSYSTVGMGDQAGGGSTFTIAGNNWVWNNSDLVMSGGRYFSDPTFITGTIDVRYGAVLDLQATRAEGSGTIDAVDGGIVAMHQVLAGLHVIAYDGGGLIFYGGGKASTGGFAGDVAITAGGVIAAFGDSAAVATAFHVATGNFDLLNAAGGLVDEYHFMGGAMPRVFQGAGGITYMTGTALPGALPLTVGQ